MDHPSLPRLELGDFTSQLLQSTSELRTIHQTLVLSGGSYEALMRRFDSYKRSLPRCGAVILNQDLTKVLLVLEIRGGWGFPKGKLKEGEEDHVVAIREVFEEIGFDIGPFISQDEFIERYSKGTRRKLFIVPYVSEAINFVPTVRNEIRDIKWFELSNLNQMRGRIGAGVASQFFAIFPFLQPLTSWISVRKNPTRYEHVDVSTVNSDFAWYCTIKGSILEPFHGVGHYIDGPVIIEHISNQNVLTLSGVISREEMLNKLSTIGDVYTRSVICIEPVHENDFLGYSNCYSRLKNVMQGVGVIYENQQSSPKTTSTLVTETTSSSPPQRQERETTPSETTPSNTQPSENNTTAASEKNDNTNNAKDINNNNNNTNQERRNGTNNNNNNNNAVSTPICEGMYLVPLDVNAFSSSSFIRTHAYDTYMRSRKIGADDTVKRERLLLVVIMKWNEK
eukprot:TRINITY_DN4171_c0_g1_i2.p1 TRINITY_DN4171_c0_g1~~TRINITY_DN4171_c0_g1_i2.p1  ORF type:complete len:452 (+),score=96.59 TRINITY_DN4171_c0_g1_i2:336-1691(+)